MMPVSGSHKSYRSFSLRLLAAAVALIAALAAVRACLPKPELDISFSRRIFDRHGELMRLSLTPDAKYRLPVRLDGLPPGLIDAVIRHEDRGFFGHGGVAPLAVARAFLGRLLGRSRSGASTITMQLARLRFGIRSARLQGKLEQAARAIQLEAHYSKQALLEAYFNRVPMGGNIEGIGAASWIYFGKLPADLTQAECDALSLIPQCPARRAPRGESESPSLLAARTNLSARRGGSGDCPAPLRFQRNLPFAAPHLACRIEHTIPPADVATTIDLNLQQGLESELSRYISSVSNKGVLNAAVLLADFHTGEILASVGSAGFSNVSISGKIDGTRARRSPGSTVKPFVYALAMQEGLIHPGSVVADVPSTFGSYRPGNFDRAFLGQMTVREALIHSRNIPAIILAATLRPATATRLLEWAGAKQPVGAGLAIGGFDMTMERLATLWCALANGGNAVLLHTISASPPGVPLVAPRWFTPESSSILLAMLASPENSHPFLRPGEAPIAWKTGTSQGFRDAWCCAAFDRYVLCVWLGAFGGKSNPALVGREMAAPLLFRMVARVRESRPADPNWLPAPEKTQLVRVKICMETGCLAGPGCPHPSEEWFWPGISPITVCHHNEKPAPSLEIESPSPSISYVAERRTSADRAIPLRAKGAANNVFWFAGEQFLGSADAAEPVWWSPSPGNYRITVIDSRGRSAIRPVCVVGM